MPWYDHKSALHNVSNTVLVNQRRVLFITLLIFSPTESQKEELWFCPAHVNISSLLNQVYLLFSEFDLQRQCHQAYHWLSNKVLFTGSLASCKWLYWNPSCLNNQISQLLIRTWFCYTWFQTFSCHFQLRAPRSPVNQNTWLDRLSSFLVCVGQQSHGSSYTFMAMMGHTTPFSYETWIDGEINLILTSTCRWPD